MDGPATHVNAPLRVLVVDDDPSVAELMQLLLDHQGIDASEVACSGAEAFDALARGPYDAAIVDLELPDMDGARVLAEVRRRAPSTKLVVCSAHPWDSPQVLRAREFADAVIAKHDIARAGALLHELCGRATQASI